MATLVPFGRLPIGAASCPRYPRSIVLILKSPLKIGLNPNSEIEWGARPPRALFSAPSRKTSGCQELSWALAFAPRAKVLDARARPATPAAGVLPSFRNRVENGQNGGTSSTTFHRVLLVGLRDGG